MGDIAECAVAPITERGYPTTYAAWGANGIERINALMRPAAEIIASSPGCDRLELLGLSNDRSSPPDNIVFFADCKNGSRFFITEGEILAKRQAVSQNDKSKWLAEEQLAEICREAVKARLTGPCIFVSHGIYRAIAGRTVVTLVIQTTKDASAIVTREARCFFDGLSLTAVEFYEP